MRHIPNHRQQPRIKVCRIKWIRIRIHSLLPRLVTQSPVTRTNVPDNFLRGTDDSRFSLMQNIVRVIGLDIMNGAVGIEFHDGVHPFGYVAVESVGRLVWAGGLAVGPVCGETFYYDGDYQSGVLDEVYCGGSGDFVEVVVVAVETFFYGASLHGLVRNRAGIPRLQRL
jgi:hypothetical protein